MSVYTDQTSIFRAIVELLIIGDDTDNVNDAENGEGWEDAWSDVLPSACSVVEARLQQRLKSALTYSRQTLTKKKGAGCSPTYMLYTSSAREILSDLKELRALILEKRRDYILDETNSFQTLYHQQNSFRCDADRTRFDHEIDEAVKQSHRLIKQFEEQINKDKTLRTDDELKHLRLVGRFLIQQLRDVCTLIAQLRQIYLRKQHTIRRLCRLANLVEMWETSPAAREEAEKNAEYMRRVATRMREKMEASDVPALATIKKETSARNVDGWDLDEVGEVWSNVIDHKSDDFKSTPLVKTESQETDLHLKQQLSNSSPRSGLKMFSKTESKIMKNVDASFPFDSQENNKENEVLAQMAPKLSKYEQEQLEAENHALYARLAQEDRELDTLETNLVEIQRLQHVFAEKVTEQEHDIDLIHTHTINSLDNLDAANRFIRQAIENQANRRVVVLFCLIVLTFTLLFLDWYNP